MGKENASAAVADSGGFTPDSLEMPDSLFEDDGEQPGDDGTDGADGTGEDDGTPAKSDEEKAGGDQKEAGENGKAGEVEQPATLDVDGEVYTAERIKELKEGTLRWADYTKKTTELADQRKSVDALRGQIEPLIQWVDKIKADKELVNDIRQALPEDQQEAFDAALSLDSSKVQHPDTKALNELRAQYSELQARETLEKDAKDLVGAFGIARDVADKVIEAAIQYHSEKGVYRTPEDQYKIMLADGLIPKPGEKPSVDEKPADKGKTTPKPPANVPKGAGAKNLKQPAKGGFENIPLSAFKGVVE
jgi:hypothetical protein